MQADQRVEDQQSRSDLRERGREPVTVLRQVQPQAVHRDQAQRQAIDGDPASLGDAGDAVADRCRGVLGGVE
jgi:hypothetical protein